MHLFKYSLCVLVALSAFVMAAEAAESRPNVLMIAIDDLADYPLEPKFNAVQTPHLDRFARSALSFTKAYCASPLCNPSRSAVLSGIAPHRSGVLVNYMRWEQTPAMNDSLAFPELFKQNGYTTMWSGKLWHGTSTPSDTTLDQWFDEHNKHRGFAPLSKEHANELKGITLKRNGDRFGMLDIPDDKWQDTRVANDTIRRLEQSYDEPFFMVAGFVRPHAPWTAPKRFFDLYNRDEIKLPPWDANDWDDIPADADNILEHQYHWDAFVATGLWKDVIHSYLACISFVDWNIGRVLQALEESPYAENTIVILWSDHGFHMGEKSYFCKSALWEQTGRVPFLVRTPGMELKGAQCDDVVSLLDIYPTMVDLCSLTGAPVDQFDGRSLGPLITGQGTLVNEPALTSYLTDNHSLRDARFRFTRYQNGGEELYDHQSDPDEFKNLARDPEYKSVRDSMAQRLEQALTRKPALFVELTEAEKVAKKAKK